MNGKTMSFGALYTSCLPGNPQVADSSVGITTLFLRPLRSEGLDLEFEGMAESSCSSSGFSWKVKPYNITILGPKAFAKLQWVQTCTSKTHPEPLKPGKT